MKHLSKSQYTRGQQCLKSLWLYRQQPNLQDPVTPEQQATFDAGAARGADGGSDGLLLAGH